MTAPARNIVNLHAVEKGYGPRTVLRGVSLGVASGDRIGIVGRNGEGKSTLVRLIAGAEEPDAGTVTRTGGVTVALLGQGDDLDSSRTIRDELVGGRADHEWAGDAAFRAVLDGLLGGVEMRRFPRGLDSPIGPLSGGERRRIALARALLGHPDLLALDEPTNHLDVEGIDWLARHLAARRGSLVVITHDRWFLDAVCTQTWEVGDTTVHQYEGGYAAYTLARAERARQAAAREERRQQLLRKELAWLRRGPPARTSKPKFRIEAANALIADEPAPRDTVELLRFATARLGGKVVEAEHVSVAFGDRVILRDATWRLGPGARIAIVGANGSGKTTLVDVLAGDRAPDAGTVERGATVRLAHLSQDTAEIPGHLRVLEALTEIRGRIALGDGSELTAGQLAERFGFRGDRGRTLVRDLSGGERRRLQLMRLLMGEPNVLLARRAHERPRHRHAHRARGPARQLAGHARRRQPRPLVRRARVRRRARAGRPRRDPPSAGRHRAVRRGVARGDGGRRGEPAREARADCERRRRRGSGAARPAARSARRARSSAASSARSTASASARRGCTRRWPRRRRTTCASASSPPSCAPSRPSATTSRPRGSRPPPCSSADAAGRRGRGQRGALSRSVDPEPPRSCRG